MNPVSLRRNTCLFLMLLMASATLTAQNARFSQISSAPMLFNPSLSGRFDGQARVSSLFSWQKSETAFMAHQNLAFDIKLGKYKFIGDEEAYQPDTAATTSPKKPVTEAKDETFSKEKKRNGYWSLGANYYHYGTDLLGFYDNTSPVRASFYSVNIARHFYLKRNRYFGFGVQGTYATAKLDESNGVEYDKEISGGSFRYSNKNANNRVSKNDYFDFNAGVYFGMMTEPLSFEIGLAMYHLFYPSNDIFNLDAETELRHRMTLHSVLRFKVSPKWGVLQKNMYWGEGLYWKSTSFYDSAHIIALWTGFEMYKTDPKSKINLNFGFYSRSFRTLMPLINLNLGYAFNMKLTYEFPVNSDKFNAYTAERTELSFMYNFRKNTANGTRFYKKFNYW